MGSYPIGIVGESFDNDDGSSRQAEIRRCVAGEAVELERDPGNKYDSNCVKVLSSRGVQIGNISRDDGWICERLDKGGFVDARILSVGRSKQDKSGVVLCVRTIEDDEWLPEATDTPGKAPSQATPTGLEMAKGCLALLFLIFIIVVVALVLFG